MRKILFLFNQLLDNSFATGGDVLGKMIMRYGLESRDLEVSVMIPKFASKTFSEINQYCLGDTFVEKKLYDYSKVYTVFPLYIARTFESLRYINQIDADVVYTTGDFLCDVLPAYLLKKRKGALWVACVYHINDLQQAQWVKGAFEKSYEKFHNLLSTDTYPLVTFFILPMSDYGSAQPMIFDGQKRCRIKIRSGLNKTFTEASVAHELFHCFQFAIGMNSATPVSREWAMEGTAVWAENYVYSNYNTEHEYLKTFFKDLDTSLIANHGVVL